MGKSRRLEALNEQGLSILVLLLKVTAVKQLTVMTFKMFIFGFRQSVEMNKVGCLTSPGFGNSSSAA